MKRLFSSSSLSAIKVVSSAYLRLLIFLLAILIPACASSSPAFHMVYSAYKLNKHGDNIQLWHTPFPIWNQSAVPWPVLTIASWPAYRFLRRQVRWSGIPISRKISHNLFWSTLLCQQRSIYSRLWFFQWSCMDVRVGLWRKLITTELMLLNCGDGEDSWESLGLQEDPTSPFWRRSALEFLWKEWC